MVLAPVCLPLVPMLALALQLILLLLEAQCHGKVGCLLFRSLCRLPLYSLCHLPLCSLYNLPLCSLLLLPPSCGFGLSSS